MIELLHVCSCQSREHMNMFTVLITSSTHMLHFDKGIIPLPSTHLRLHSHLSHPIHLFFQTLHIPENIVTSIPPPALLPPIMPLPLLLRPLPLLLLRRKRNLALAHDRRITRRLGRFPVFKLTNTRTERLVFRHRRRPRFPLVRRRNNHFGASALRAMTCFAVGTG